MNNLESKLQHDLIMWFGQKYPQYRNLLIEINNDTYSMYHAVKRKSMGMVPGASDLIFIIPTSTFPQIAGLELKARGSVHKSEKILRQLEWGKSIKDIGGYYIISPSLIQFKLFIDTSLNHLNSLPALQELNDIYQYRIYKQIESKKTVKF